MDFATRRLAAEPDAIAPDGSAVRVLLALRGGSMAHFELAPGRTSKAVTHRTVEEIWFFLAGRGEMWRRQGDREEVTPVEAGVCLTLPVGVHFQFRALGDASLGDEALTAVGVTLPPWPGDQEAYEVAGIWQASPE